MRNLTRLGYGVDYGPASDARVLAQALHLGTPPILLVLTENLPYWQTRTAHAVVLVDMDDEVALVNDPAFAERQVVSLNHLLLAWSDFDQLYAVISPTAGAATTLRQGLPQK